MIIQFNGESRKESIINHFGFDIIEGEDFFDFIKGLGYSDSDKDEIIESLHEMFLER